MLAVIRDGTLLHTCTVVNRKEKSCRVQQCTDDCNRPNRPRLKFGTVKYYVVLFLPYFNVVKSTTTIDVSWKRREECHTNMVDGCRSTH